MKVLSHILSDFNGDRQPPLSLPRRILAPSSVSHYNYCYFCLGATSGVRLGTGASVSLEEVDKVGKGSGTLRGHLRTKAAAKSEEVSAHNTGALHYSDYLLFIALGIHCFTALEVAVRCKCYICLATVLCTNCIWYLHFYDIKSDFIGVYIQKLGFRFRVVWLKTPAVLLKKLQQNN